MIEHRGARAAAEWMIASSLLLCVGTAYAADYALEPPVALGSARFMRMAASADGRTVLVTWSDPDGAKSRRSSDGGTSFSPTSFVVKAPNTPYVTTFCPLGSGQLFCRKPLFDVLFGSEYGTAPVVTADGRASHVMAGLSLDTGARPGFGLPPQSKISVMSLYSDAGGGFVTNEPIVSVQDTCAVHDAVGCASLREFDLAADDAGRRFAVVFNTYGYDGQEQGETLIARGEAGRAFEAPINLSERLLGTRAGNDFRPHVAMNGTGSKFFVTWVEQTRDEADEMHLARSLDGGTTWTLLSSSSATFYDADVDYARDAGSLVWAYQTGFFFADPARPSVIAVRRSTNDGATLSPPVVVAQKRELGAGDTVQVKAPVRVATARDGRTVAVLHSEERCYAQFGCLGGSVEPLEVVLSVSQDGGTTFERVGVVAQTYFDSSYEVSITADGSRVFVITSAATTASGTVLIRAKRN